MPGVNQATQGRRGYYLYEYGTHLWFPQTQEDFSAGIFPDLARQAIPGNGCYDCADMLLDRPGVVYKRGGGSYQNTSGVITSGYGTVTYISAVTEGYFPNGTFGAFVRPVAVTDLGDLVLFYPVSTVGTGYWPGVVPADKMKMFVGGSKNLLVVTDSTGASIPYAWDGTTAYRPLGGTSQTLTVTGTPTGGTVTVSASEITGGTFTASTASLNFNSTNAQAKTALDGMGGSFPSFTVTGGPLPGTPLVITANAPGCFLSLASTYNHLTGGSSPAAAFTWQTTATNCPAALYSTMHLSRIVLACTTANPNRIFFSPVPDPTTAWDATSYVDANNAITGLAVVGGALLVFSRGAIEKYIGDIPPGVNATTNLTHSTVAQVGTPDARSITVSGGICYFANYNGVWWTDGIQAKSLTDGKLTRYWRTTISTASVLSTEMYARRYLVVQALASNRTLLLGLVLDTFTGAWTRITGNPAMMLSPSAHSLTDQLYAASAAGANVLKLSGMWSPGSGNKNDADGTAIAPLLETRPYGNFPSLAAFGRGHFSYDMRDAATDNPTMAVSVAPGIEAPTYTAAAESPLAETTDGTRTRFSTGKRSQGVSLKFQQTNASSKTEIYAVEVDTRGFPREAGGQ